MYKHGDWEIHLNDMVREKSTGHEGPVMGFSHSHVPDDDSDPDPDQICIEIKTKRGLIQHWFEVEDAEPVT